MHAKAIPRGELSPSDHRREGRVHGDQFHAFATTAPPNHLAKCRIREGREHPVEPGSAVCLLPLREVELLNGNRNAVLLGIEHNLADRVAYRGGNLSTAAIL
jgi:hypothetical protein